MKFLKIKSYAKVNLSLNIIGKLRSKLHKIESLVTFVNLHDLIYLRPIHLNRHKVYFEGKFSKGISNKNTVSKLLQMLDKKKLLNNQKFEIRIKKNIPQKSGMGGGSMNAASLINYFYNKKIIKLNKKRLINLANLIGSDVILGINPKNTILSSNGKLTKFKKKLGFYVLIVRPNFGCSTRLIYSKVKYYSQPKYNNSKQSLLSKNNIINSSNTLEKIAFKKYPKLMRLKLFLLKLSNIIFVRMTGSGSSILAYFYSKKSADIARKEFKKKFNNYWCITSKTI
jgi:4-diphosphocytidyl-2-C-methyl-D-erythritol kinase